MQRNPRIVLTMLMALGASAPMENCLSATGVAVKVDLPSHVEWCTKSIPLKASKLTVEEFRNGAVSALADRILVPANNVSLSGTGIPFVAEVVQVPPADGSGAANGTVVIMVCAIVNATDPPKGASVFGRQVSGASGYAAMCSADDVKPCQSSITDKIAADVPGVDRASADSWQWRITQAVGSDETAANMVGSLMDTNLRPVKGSAPAGVPPNLVVVLAFPPGQEPSVTGS